MFVHRLIRDTFRREILGGGGGGGEPEKKRGWGGVGGKAGAIAKTCLRNGYTNTKSLALLVGGLYYGLKPRLQKKKNRILVSAKHIMLL